MKKMILVLSTILICAQAASANAGDDKRAAAATKFKEECSADMLKEGLTKEIATKFCDCYVDNIMKVLTDKEVETLEKLGENDQPEKELGDKMEKAGMSCVEILSGGAQ
ncbi:hypothetical protein [Edaphocola aurantiacus]|uniref:hypothetical protein n=1 Tax=Edaphocola aurantiacus TaxID=2601682 RepID=UPI001C9448A6|nr:hypothetical protein [Edaphocola aurantiacus]